MIVCYNNFTVITFSNWPTVLGEEIDTLDILWY